MNTKTRNFIITVGSIIGLFIGFILGIVIKKTGWVIGLSTMPFFELIGKLWVILIILLVIPLITAYMINVILSMVNTKILGKLGAYSLWVHLIFIIVGVATSIIFSLSVLELIGDKLPTLVVNGKVIEESSKSIQSTTNVIEYLVSLGTSVQKILGKIVLYIIFGSIVLALLISIFFKSLSKKLIIISKLVSEKSMKWLQGYLLTLPIAVFVLIIPMASQTGYTVVGVVGSFLILICILLILCTGLIYVSVHFFGSESVSSFARAIIPSQIIAFSSRSSMSALPSLMQDAETKMGIPKTISAIILPFFVTLFRLNRVISSPFNYIFLFYVYQLHLDIPTFIYFTLTQIVISSGTPGIPSAGKLLTIPIYVAYGAPLEGIILIKVVDAIPDMFKTLLNVTEVMAVTTIVAKKAKWKFGENLI